ncbi:hypothetical protein [Megasphaera stantonii]|uniref:hypothetical protein n=1 Tax=Megasphaera stantonii TaxID=2144175 RepID=UPI002942CEEF|nr:hypothetical protein [Megasphaera stantonii]
MIIAACVDDAMGMAFNHRRQSRDVLLTRRLLQRAASRIVWIHPDSAVLFEAQGAGSVRAAEDFLQQAGSGDICFVETAAFASWEDEIEEIWLYRWNRAYPGDVFFPISLAQGWKLAEKTDFSGNSHACITEEIYKK